ncbi:hypothetical protein RXV86_10835 [Alisedimentitalea sp. MJ-SS2]|uniref:hypothetical protein n=1 Tax=Aliisedimentitalea sp. MJ-SS2 TaxID=3049795 RepID=UPI00290F2E55|nr:hypothetical protein [Alisedimentitalea sp. MJ-SS2]MDU8927878.1 hypothetical protein [Alisedimentitalea sp. MJ-SS2]
MPYQTRDQYVLSFYRVRQALGILGLVFPFLLIFGGLLQDAKIQPTISDYYHTTLRDIFVGALFAIGIFLVSYKGHSRENGERISDNMAATLAGVGAFGLAIFPNQLVPGTLNIFEHFLGQWAKIGHFLSAILFLGAMAYFSLIKFARTNNSNRRRIYYICGWVILGGGLGATLFSILRALPSLGHANWIETSGIIFWFEAIGIWAFGLSWLVKGKADIMVVRQIKRARRNRNW